MMGMDHVESAGCSRVTRMCVLLLRTFILLYIDTANSDDFDSTRLGGDRAIPTPTGLAVLWLLTNSSFPMHSYNNSNATINTAPFSWLSNITNGSLWTNGSGETFQNTVDSKWGSASGANTAWSETVTSNISSSSPTFGDGTTTTTISFPTSSQSQYSYNISTNMMNATSTVAVLISSTNGTTETSTTVPTTLPDVNSSSSNGATTTELYSPEKKEPPFDRNPLCRRYQESELYGLLQNEGGYNQYFMANSPDEVGRLPGFKLHDDPLGYEDSYADAYKRVQRSAAVDADTWRKCTGRCKHISTIVQNALEDLKPSMDQSVDKSLARDAYDSALNGTTNDAVIMESTNSSANATKAPHKFGFIAGLCRVEHFIPIGRCDQRAEEEYFGLDRLCSACRGVYKLPRGCFPQFLNAITCNTTDVQCIFDVWTKTAHGTCREKTITFTVMHNLGDDQCQEWRFESVDVPIGCQCYLSKSSWLKA